MDPKARVTIGQRVRQRRLDLGMQVAQCVQQSGVSSATWERIEAGGGPGRADTMAKVAACLQTTPDWLWNGEEAVAGRPQDVGEEMLVLLYRRAAPEQQRTMLQEAIERVAGVSLGFGEAMNRESSAMAFGR